jgi:hypothetical protein
MGSYDLLLGCRGTGELDTYLYLSPIHIIYYIILGMSTRYIL